MSEALFVRLLPDFPPPEPIGIVFLSEPRFVSASMMNNAVKMDDELADVPSFSTGASFFDANAQAHHIPLSAFGDLTDNSSEAGASQLLIAIEDSSCSSNLAISMTDDGCGMTEHKLRTGIGGIGHSDKGDRSEDHCAHRPATRVK